MLSHAVMRGKWFCNDTCGLFLVCCFILDAQAHLCPMTSLGIHFRSVVLVKIIFHLMKVLGFRLKGKFY